MRQEFFITRPETWIESEKLYEVLYSFEMEGVEMSTKKNKVKFNIAMCITH